MHPTLSDCAESKSNLRPHDFRVLIGKIRYSFDQDKFFLKLVEKNSPKTTIEWTEPYQSRIAKDKKTPIFTSLKEVTNPGGGAFYHVE